MFIFAYFINGIGLALQAGIFAYHRASLLTRDTECKFSWLCCMHQRKCRSEDERFHGRYTLGIFMRAIHSTHSRILQYMVISPAFALPLSRCSQLIGAGALASPLVATEFSHLPQWNLHFLTSLGIAISNTIALSVVFRLKPQEGKTMCMTLFCLAFEIS